MKSKGQTHDSKKIYRVKKIVYKKCRNYQKSFHPVTLRIGFHLMTLLCEAQARQFVELPQTASHWKVL